MSRLFTLTGDGAEIVIDGRVVWGIGIVRWSWARMETGYSAGTHTKIQIQIQNILVTHGGFGCVDRTLRHAATAIS